jgi:hypothetical protein
MLDELLILWVVFYFCSQRELQLNHRHLVEQEELVGVSLARMVLGLMAAGVGVMVVQVAIGAGVQVARVAKVAALVPKAMVIPIPIAIVAPMAEVVVVEMAVEEVVVVVVEVEEEEEDGVEVVEEEDGVEVVEVVEGVEDGRKLMQ